MHTNKPMKHLRRTLRISCLVGLLGASASALAQSSEAVSTLVEQALFAQSVSDWTKARNAWDKVLLNDRNQPDALRGLFYEKLQQGQVEAAATFLAKLAEVDSAHPYLQIMRADANKVESSISTIIQARKSISDDNVAAGLELYRISFGRVDPNGLVALEFYTTLGATESGWEEAATGLKRLVEESPDEWTYQLAYAKHLTYRVSERGVGIGKLIELVGQPVSRSSALPALRESIRWLPNAYASLALYEQYVAVVEDDDEIVKRIAALRSARNPAQERQLQQAFKAMEEDSLEAAAANFKRILSSRENDADALAGLGLLELRQSNFVVATDLLSRALKSNGANRSDWRRALNTARYWSKIEAARELVSNESYAAAITLLFEAIEINPTDETGLVLMAEALFKQGNTDEAEKYYLQIIDINPSNAVALRGLGQLYNELEQFDKAQQLAQRLNDSVEGGTDTVADGIIAQSFVASARAHMKRNDFDLAQVDLEKAQKVQPYDPWVNLELAQLLIRRGRSDRAGLLMSELEQQTPLSASVLHALAEFSHIENRHGDALTYLERIPAAERTPPMTNTQNRVWMRLQVQRSVTFAQNNEFGRARKTLGEAENFAGSQAGMAGALASGWIELGEEERALSIMRSALRLNPDVWLQLQYAGLLLKVQKNRELDQIISALRVRSDLDEFQLRELSHIELSLALRKSDQYLKDEQYARAYSELDPYLQLEDEYPNIRMMLGRLYQVTGDTDQALASYNKILRDHANHLDARRSAVGLLIDRKGYADAQRLVDDGLELFSEHPRMVLLAGQLEAARGRPKLALSYYKRALTLVSSESTTPGFSDVRFRIPDENENLALSGANTSVIDFLDAPEALALESAVGLREDILTEIGRTNAKTSNYVQVGGELRNRSGQAGLDKLTMFRLPVEYNFGLGNSGRVSLGVTAESLNADDIQLSDVNGARRFGSLSLDTSLPREEILSVSESGLGFRLAYDSRYFSVDVGSTPTDYAVTNAVGGISATNNNELFKITGTISQRAQEDSILSYAGQVDPFLGLAWGGVVKTGGELRIEVDRQRQGFYGNVAGYSLEGENVASNSMTQFGGGVFWRVKQTATSELRLGLDIDSLSYDENLSGHTFGHGGYFSPQSYVNVGVPIQWRGDTGAMQYLLTGKVGFERFDQDDNVFFPNDATLQLQLEELALTAVDPQQVNLRGSSDTGVSISLRGEVNYQLSSRLSIGSTMRLQTSGEFNESQIGLFTRYYFAPQEVRAFAPASDADRQISLNRW